MSLAAGKLNRRLRVMQEQGPSRDEFGQKDATWTEVAERWAAIEPLTGRELWQAAQVRAELTHKVTIRALGLELTTKHRFEATVRGKRLILNIDSAADLSLEGEQYVCMCRAEVANVTNPEP